MDIKAAYLQAPMTDATLYIKMPDQFVNNLNLKKISWTAPSTAASRVDAFCERPSTPPYGDAG